MEYTKFWKRTNYFAILVGSLFISYYTIIGKGQYFIESLLLFIGSMISLIWLLSNFGSKFWQENWEHHIDFLENESGAGKIYQTILYEKAYRAFSVSKLSISSSFIVFTSWISLLFYKFIDIPIILTCGYWPYILIFILFLGSIIFIIWYCTSGLAKKIKERDK